MKRLCLIFLILIAAILAVSAAQADTISIRPYGLATPYWYGYSAGAKSDYYLSFPSLSANATAFPSLLTTNAPDVANSIWGVENGLRGEGATADAYEWTLTPDEPTADRTYTIGDFSGALPMVIAQGTMQTQVSQGEPGGTSADVTGSSITIPDGWLSAGKTLRWTVSGESGGGNALFKVHLYTEGVASQDIFSLSTANGAAGDWTAIIEMAAIDDNTQIITGRLFAEGGAEVIVVVATATIDKANAGTIPAKLRLETTHVGDSVSAEHVKVEFFKE